MAREYVRMARGLQGGGFARGLCTGGCRDGALWQSVHSEAQGLHCVYAHLGELCTPGGTVHTWGNCAHLCLSTRVHLAVQ